MKFGWVSEEITLGQNYGFFVNEDYEIGYWPSKKGIGYTLTPEQAIEISKIEKDWWYWIAGPVLLIVGGAVVHYGAYYTFPLVETYFSATDWMFTFGSLVFLLSLGATWKTLGRWRERLHQRYLESNFPDAPEIHFPRPRVTLIKPSELMGFIPFWLLVSFSLGFSAWISWNTFPIGDQLIGDAILAFFFSLSFLVLVCVALYIEVRGERWKDQFVLMCFRKSDRQKPFTQMLRGFLVNMAIPVLIVVGAFIFIEFLPKDYIQADYLKGAYQEAVFGVKLKGQDEIQVIKWQHAPSVYIDPALPKKLKKYLGERFRQMAYESGLNIEFADDNEPRANIAVLNNEEIQLWKSGNPRAVQWAGKQKDGNILWLEMKFSDKALVKGMGPEHFGDHEYTDVVYDNVAIDLVLKGAGLRGPFDFAYPEFFSKDDRWIDLPNYLIAMHYDPEIKPNALEAEVMPIVSQIAHEMEQANNLKEWLVSHRGMIAD